MFYKNIIVIGASRSGKTTLARKISKKYGYSLSSMDDIILGFDGIPELEINHYSKDSYVEKFLSNFFKIYFKEISEGPNFYGGIKTVVEGTTFDFESLMPFFNQKKYKEKYLIIGLTYNNLTFTDLYNNIKKYDTEDDWTYYCSEEEIKKHINCSLERNKYFSNEFKKYNILTYDTSFDREKVLDKIIEEIENLI